MGNAEANMAQRYEHEIPEGYEARIEGNKVIIEHKESEDERIRKVLIHIVKGACDKYGIKYKGDEITEEKLLAYLERQKDLAAIPDELIKNYKLFCEQGGRELALLINAINGFNKQKEQQPAEWSDSVAKEMFIKALERAVEQTKKGYELTDCDKHSWWEDFKAYSGINPAEWGEEDRKMLEAICTIIRMSVPVESSAKEKIDWLKSSLRPQLKKDWSMEDAIAMKDIQMIISVSGRSEKNKRDLCAWVAEHCNAYPIPEKLRPHWKPSEVQMEALAWYSGNSGVPPTGDKAIKSLYHDLQKLL